MKRVNVRSREAEHNAKRKTRSLVGLGEVESFARRPSIGISRSPATDEGRPAEHGFE